MQCVNSESYKATYYAEINLPGQLNDITTFWVLPEDCRYKYAMSIFSLGKIIKMSMKKLGPYLYGCKEHLFFPRKYIAKYGESMSLEDDGNIVFLMNVFPKLDACDCHNFVTLEGFKNIIWAYSHAYYTGELKSNQADLGQRLSYIGNTFLPGLEDKILMASGFKPGIEHEYKKYHDDELFCNEYKMLHCLLKEVYPDRDKYKYEALSNTIFGYIYQDILGKSGYDKLKKSKHVFDRAHRYISDQKTRLKMKAYLAMFIAIMKFLHNRKMFDEKGFGSKTNHARVITRNIFHTLI